MKDQRIEQWLTGFKVQWTYEEAFRLDRIREDDTAKISRQQIRMTEAVSDETVQRYAMALEGGAEFPGIVVSATPELVLVVNGWHRIAAFRMCERVTIPAYVLGPLDATLLTVLRRTANTIEGVPPSPEEALEHALWLVRTGAYSQADAARLMLVSVNRVGDRCLFDEARARLAAVGIVAEGLHISPSGIARLAKVRDRELSAVATFAHEARLPLSGLIEITRDVKAAQSDEEADRVLERWRTRYADDIQRSRGGTVRPPGSPIRRLPILLAQAERLLGTRTRDAIRTLAPAAMKQLIAVCERTIVRLEEVIAACKEATR